MKKYIKRILLIALFFAILFLGSIIYLALTPVTESEVGTSKQEAQIFSRNLIISNYGRFKNLTDSDYAPNILDEDYVWENLNESYFNEIREDPRLKSFYGKYEFDLQDYLEMREYLRDLFQHGEASKSHFNENLLVMIDEAQKGEEFICGDISKMLCQMIMASGTYARTVRISDKIGLGHVVVEYWSKEYNKWILLDPDYNVYFTTLDDVPLNGIELYKSTVENKPILSRKGQSPNTLFNDNSKIFEQYYSYGVSIDFYDKWVSKNYGRSNPASSPVNCCVYIGRNELRKKYFVNHFDLEDQHIINLVYSNPFEQVKSIGANQ